MIVVSLSRVVVSLRGGTHLIGGVSTLALRHAAYLAPVASSNWLFANTHLGNRCYGNREANRAPGNRSKRSPIVAEAGGHEQAISRTRHFIGGNTVSADGPPLAGGTPLLPRAPFSPLYWVEFDLDAFVGCEERLRDSLERRGSDNIDGLDRLMESSLRYREVQTLIEKNEQLISDLATRSASAFENNDKKLSKELHAELETLRLKSSDLKSQFRIFRNDLMPRMLQLPNILHSKYCPPDAPCLLAGTIGMASGEAEGWRGEECLSWLEVEDDLYKAAIGEYRQGRLALVEKAHLDASWRYWSAGKSVSVSSSSLSSSPSRVFSFSSKSSRTSELLNLSSSPASSSSSTASEAVAASSSLNNLTKLKEVDSNSLFTYAVLLSDLARGPAVEAASWPRLDEALRLVPTKDDYKLSKEIGDTVVNPVKSNYLVGSSSLSAFAAYLLMHQLKSTTRMPLRLVTRGNIYEAPASNTGYDILRQSTQIAFVDLCVAEKDCEQQFERVIGQLEAFWCNYQSVWSLRLELCPAKRLYPCEMGRVSIVMDTDKLLPAMASSSFSSSLDTKLHGDEHSDTRHIELASVSLLGDWMSRRANCKLGACGGVFPHMVYARVMNSRALLDAFQASGRLPSINRHEADATATSH